MKILKTFLLGSIGLVVIIALVLGYFGFIPFISRVMGTDKPKDLGMAFSQEKYDEGLSRAQVELKPLPPESNELVMYEGSHKVQDYFSDEELTAHAWNKDFVGYPIANVQVRINDDSSMEVSGIIKLSQMGPFLEAMRISEADYQKALKEANLPMIDLPFYAKGMGTASDNALNIDVTGFEVGRFPVPANIINQYEDELMAFGKTIMNRIDGFSVNEARIENGSIYFDGTLPDAELMSR